MAAKVRAGVVRIDNLPGSVRFDATGFGAETDSSYETGSGFFLDMNGQIATDAHVVLPDAGQTSRLRVTTNSGQQFGATIVNLDIDHDIAIIQLDGNMPADAKPIALSAKRNFKADDPMWLVAYNSINEPLTVAPGNFSHWTTSAKFDRRIASYLELAAPCVDSTFSSFAQRHHSYMDSTQLNFKMHGVSGNSGAPAVDGQGRAVGLAVKALSPQLSRQVPSSVYETLVTPISYLQRLQHTPSKYRFLYTLDPSSGHQMLMEINRISDASRIEGSVPSATLEAYRACKSDKTNQQDKQP
jgi:S1-C subfamily serine protease